MITNIYEKCSADMVYSLGTKNKQTNDILVTKYK